jgi:gluconolactonase
MVFATDLKAPEGPVLLPDRSWLVVEMGANPGCVTHISSDGQKKRVIAETGRPNGLAIDKEGLIWVAESETPSLLRLTMDADVEVFLTDCDGDPFLFPNDLAFGPDGALYMTDSGILYEDILFDGKLRPDFMELYPDGRVYRIDLRNKRVTKLDSGIRFTNGIAFGPDDNLYVNETLTGTVYRYRVKNGELVGGREDFGNSILSRETLKAGGPDGMKFGADGNLYVTSYEESNVTVLGMDGTVLDRIKTRGKCPTNLAFGPKGEKKIYVTEVEFGCMEVLDVDTEGLPLHT